MITIKNEQAFADMLAEAITSTTKEVMTVEDAAKFLGLAKGYLYKLTMRKQIPHYKPQGKIYFKRAELEQWAMQNRVETEEETEQRAFEYCNKEVQL